MKMSIAGATGEVTGATARRPHQETALGRCVAAALSNAKLERFRKPSIGVVYPVRM